MSRFITRNPDGTYLEEIDSMEICKWKCNDVCCNDSSEYLGDFSSEYCYENSKLRRECFEKEDGIIEN